MDQRGSVIIYSLHEIGGIMYLNHSHIPLPHSRLPPPACWQMN